MTPTERIVSKFGSLRGLSRALGHKNSSTVQGWMERGLVPIQHAPQIMAVSQELAEPVVPEDFIPETNESADLTSNPDPCSTPHRGALA